MDAVKERIHKREAEEAVKTRRRNKETAALAQAAEEEARASVAAAERQGATMAAGLAQAEHDIKEALGDALGPEPDAFETALVPPQVSVRLQGGEPKCRSNVAAACCSNSCTPRHACLQHTPHQPSIGSRNMLNV